MKKLFFSHPDIVLTTIAIVLLGILFWFYSWAVNAVLADSQKALMSQFATSQQGFDLTAAAKLDLRGLAVSSSTADTIRNASGTTSSSDQVASMGSNVASSSVTSTIRVSASSTSH